MEEPTESHRRLERLAGDWRGEETHHPFPGFPETVFAGARVRARFALNGLFLLRDYETRRDGELLYQGHGLYGWDARRQRYTIYWFDTAGTDPVAPALGEWSDETLVFEYHRGEQPMRLVYRFLDEDRYTFAVEADAPDGWKPILSGQYQRIAG